jgi:iron complex outermembrane receptor protein
MEERSPGSYRLSIRGSTLRSPFGVRNIKFYWNDIPFTDGGGNTYLDLIAPDQLTSAEVIKGPAASMYGAGTGGAVLLKSVQPFSPVPTDQLKASVSGGSYGLFNQQADWIHQQNNFTASIEQTHMESDGYRQQSAMHKDAFKWDGNLKLKNQQLDFLFFYTDLYYQTPGGLTLAQMTQNPRSARPASGAIPGAVQQQAAIYNKTLWGGINHTYQLNASFSTETSVMLDHTAYTNPFITDYENRDETNAGVRSQLIYHHTVAGAAVQWVTGGELVYNHSRIDDYGNVNGRPDTVQLKDDLFANQWFVFSQLQVSYGRFELNAGVSLNNQGIHYKRLSDPTMTHYVNTNSEDVFAPRVSLLYKISSGISLYGVMAKGFSPPTLAEVHPQDKVFHHELQPEYGWNYEAGVKGALVNNRLQFDLAVYDLELKEAIVMRINAQDEQYFVNAGRAAEKGTEAWVEYHLIRSSLHFFSGLSVWSSYSYQPYHFTSYTQGTDNYSGNAVTGVPGNVWVSGFDLETRGKEYLHLIYNSTSSLPLDDANDEYAKAYHLLQLKCGERFSLHRFAFDVFGGVDNLLNEVYSLGDDINAANRRFYNPAAGRNYYIGLSCSLGAISSCHSTTAGQSHY